jgi:hypothetical protein
VRVEKNLQVNIKQKKWRMIHMTTTTTSTSLVSAARARTPINYTRLIQHRLDGIFHRHPEYVGCADFVHAEALNQARIHTLGDLEAMFAFARSLIAMGVDAGNQQIKLPFSGIVIEGFYSQLNDSYNHLVIHSTDGQRLLEKSIYRTPAEPVR